MTTRSKLPLTLPPLAEQYTTVASFNALLTAHRAARRNKRYKPEITAFEMNLAHNLWELKQQLDAHQYQVQDYHLFTIIDPKRREIQAASYRDRVFQHSLCDNVLTPFMEQRLISDNCACRKQKGTYYGLHRLNQFLAQYTRQHGRIGWFLKADIHHYFASIDHAILKRRLQHEKGLSSEIKQLLNRVIDSYQPELGVGLPMGNQTSQMFALYYLDSIDRLIKERFQIKYYIRYMDDMLLIHPSRSYLETVLAAMRQMASSLKLAFNQKTQLIPIKNGVEFLGWRFLVPPVGRPLCHRLRQSSKRRMLRRVAAVQQQWTNGQIDAVTVQRQLAGFKGHLINGGGQRIWRYLLRRFQLGNTN